LIVVRDRLSVAQALSFSRLYLTLKIEQRERLKTGGEPGQAGDERRASDSPGQASQQEQKSPAVGGTGATQPASGPDTGPIKATAPMWRCSRIMHMQRDLHPTVLSSLEGEHFVSID
jgi:transformation/transcription domain-associated protein